MSTKMVTKNSLFVKKCLLCFFTISIMIFTALTGSYSHAHDNHEGHHGDSHSSWVNGKVIEITQDSIAIEDTHGDEQVYSITGHTLVYIKERQMSLSDIKVGDGVNLQFAMKGDDKVVSSINIWGDGHHGNDDYY